VDEQLLIETHVAVLVVDEPEALVPEAQVLRRLLRLLCGLPIGTTEGRESQHAQVGLLACGVTPAGVTCNKQSKL